MTAKSNFDGDQLEKLKVWFDINPTPSKTQVDHIAAQIKVSPSAQVWMWFHRQRNRAKINNNISPAKTSIKGSRSTDQHMHKVKTGPLTKRLDCNGNTEDCLERLNGAEGNRQDRVRAKKVHIRGILQDTDARQQSVGRTAGESHKHMLKSTERRQHARVKFSTGDEVNTVNKTDSIQNLGQEHNRCSISRTERRVDPQECIRTEPGQHCSKRKEKVFADTVKHKRTSSYQGYIKNKEKHVDAQMRHATEPLQQRIKTATEADLQRQPRVKPSQVGINRTVTEKETRNVYTSQESTRKILKEADSQKHVSNKPFQQGMTKRDNVAKHLVQNRSSQYCTNRADKVSDNKPRSFSQLDKERLLRQDKSVHRLRTDVVPKRITPEDNISIINGVQERGKVPQEKRQIEVTPSASNRVLEEEKSILKRPVECQRKVTEHPSVHEKAGGKRVRQRHRVRNIPPSVRKKKPKTKHKVPNEIRMHWLLSGKPKTSANRVKNVKETKVSHEKPQSKRERQAKPNASRAGIFSALSLPQEKTNNNLSDSSDEDDFQDDQNKRMHKQNIIIRKTDKTDSLGNGVSIPVISRTRREGTLADCSNRSAAGKNLRRIPLKSTNEEQAKDLPVSPLSCEVSSTSTSQSSVISSTVEEVGYPNHSSKACPKSLDSPDRDSREIAVRITERSRREEKEHMENQKFEKRTVPVISNDKMVVEQDTKYSFKKELSVNLLKINLSSLSDKREVTVSSKMNPSRQDKKRKGDSPICRDDMTDKNSSVLVDFSGVPKSAERSLWSSFATPIETSNKVWSAIASSAQTPHKEIPFMETPASIDKDLNKFWSSVATSPETPHKEIPFIESSALPDGDSTPSSSQDCLESNEGQNRSNKKNKIDEDSCEVSSSVDLEKTQTDLTEIVGETEKTSSAFSKKNKDKVEEKTVDVMEITQDAQKTPEELMDIEQTSDGVGKNWEELPKTSAELEESKEGEEAFVELKKNMNEVKKTAGNFGDNLEQLDNASTESEDSNIAQVEQRGIRSEFEKTPEDKLETVREVPKASTEETEKTEIIEGKKENESDKEQGNELQDVHEDINLPDYDMDTPFIVIDEVGCSDTEESSIENTDPASPVPQNIMNSCEKDEVIDLDNDDDVIMVSSTAAKQPRSRIPRQKPLKDHSVCNGKQVGQGEPSCASKTTKKDDSHEVIELDYCSEDDEVILLTLEPSKLPNVSVNKISELSNSESAKDSPNCLQNIDHSNSVTQENSNEKEIVTAVQQTLSAKEDLIESQSISKNAEIKINTSDPVNKNSSFSDADIEICKSKSSSSVLQVDEHHKSEEILKDSAELALSPDTQVEIDEEVIRGTEEMCLIKNVVSLGNCFASEGNLANVVQSKFEVEKEDVPLEMICDTIPNKSKAIDKQKSTEMLNTSEQNAGCTEFTSSNELDIDMETCDEIESFLQGKDVVKENCASTITSEIVKVDAIKEGSRHNESTSEEELVIDVEACHQIESPRLEKEESKDISGTPSDTPTEKPVTTDRNKRRIDSASSDELVIDMEACNEKEREDSKDVGDSSVRDNMEHKDSFKASNDVDVIMTCNSETRPNAGEDLQATEDLVLPRQDSRHKEIESSDELVIDEKTLCPPLEEDASKQNMGCYDSASSDELVIDEKPCLEMQSPCKEKDTSESNGALEQNVEPSDSTSSEEPIIDDKASVETQSPPQEKDASKDTGASEQNVGLSDYALADALIIDEKPCLETQSPPQEKNASEDNCVSEQIVGCLDFNSSDKLQRDDDACDETKCPLQERDVSEEKCTNPSDAVEAEIDPPHQNRGPETVVSKELSEYVPSYEQEKCALPESNVSGSDEACSTNDPSEQEVSCDQTDLEADAATEKDAGASPISSVREFTDQAEQKEDSMSSDEEDVDVTTYNELECSEAVALLENSAMSLTGKALLPNDIKPSKSVADVLDEGPLEEGMKSNGNSPLEKDSTRIDFADVTETDLVPSTDPTLSCNVALPLEDQAHVDKKGSPPTNAESICMALSTNLDAEEASREILTTIEGDMNTTASSVQTKPNLDAAMKSTCTIKNPSPSTSSVAPSVVPQGISSVVFDTIPSRKDKSSTVQDAYVRGYMYGLDAVASPSAEDLQAQSSLSTDFASHRPPKTIIKTEPDIATKKRCRSGTNSPRLDPSPSKSDNSTERSKRPKSLTELVSDLTQRLTALSKAATQTSTTKSLDLPHSSVGINRNAHCSTKPLSTSAEATPQPQKPTPQSRRGSKRRIITNKNFKRPALSEEVQRRIQQLNPYPCDNSWMRNAAVVELAQKEVELHCQPGKTGSTKDHALEAHMESSHGPVLGPPSTSGLNFCYQPGIGPIKGDTRGATKRGSHSRIHADSRGATDEGSESTIHTDSRGATDKGSQSAIATSRMANSGNHRVEVQPNSDLTNLEHFTTFNAANSEVRPRSDLTNLEHFTTFNATNSGHVAVHHSENSKQSTMVLNHPQLNNLLKNVIPRSMKMKRSKTHSGLSEKKEKKKKKRRRSKSSNDICSERKSPTKRIISEKDIREEWMHLLDDLEGNKELPSSETVVPASSTMAPALDGNTSSSTTTASEADPSSSTATASDVDPSSSTPIVMEGISPATPDYQEASLEALKTSANALISEVDDLSDMPSILRVYSLRDEEEGGQESSQTLGDHGQGSFDFDSVRIVEEPDIPGHDQDSARVAEEPSTPAQMYPSFASAALTSAARRFADTNDLSSSSPSQEQLQSTNRKRHLPPPYGSRDGVPPSKAPAKVVNGSTFQEIPGTPLQQSHTNTTSSFTQQGSSSSINIGGSYIPIAPKQSYVINTSQIRPLIMNADDAAGATAVLAPQPVVQAVPQQPVAQVQQSILGNGNLPSLLNPLILNQQIQVRRLSASPPLCTPYPTTTVPANGISGNTLSSQHIPVPNFNYLPRVSQNITFPIPVNTQWTQPTSNLQLVPVTSQTYSPVWTVDQQLNASIRGRLPQ